MKRLLVRLGFHGVAHQKAQERIMAWMHQNGLGA